MTNSTFRCAPGRLTKAPVGCILSLVELSYIQNPGNMIHAHTVAVLSVAQYLERQPEKPVLLNA